MSTNIYVGNLPFTVTEQELRELFGNYGNVTKVNVIEDRETGRPRGFCFVEMADGGAEAISALDQSELGGRTLRVNEAKPRTERAPRDRRW
jgi:RNA recognition motif-containing protein